jgi:hypothetical protein
VAGLFGNQAPTKAIGAKLDASGPGGGGIRGSLPSRGFAPAGLQALQAAPMAPRMPDVGDVLHAHLTAMIQNDHRLPTPQAKMYAASNPGAYVKAGGFFDQFVKPRLDAMAAAHTQGNPGGTN